MNETFPAMPTLFFYNNLVPRLFPLVKENPDRSWVRADRKFIALG
jgi:hypothetical protein